MATEAVASAVIQKLTDIGKDENLASETVKRMVDHIKNQLELLRMSSSLNEMKPETERILYRVEDTVETFLLCTARRRSSYHDTTGRFFLFVQRHPSLLPVDVGGAGGLRRELKSIGEDIDRILKTPTKDRNQRLCHPIAALEAGHCLPSLPRRGRAKREYPSAAHNHGDDDGAYRTVSSTGSTTRQDLSLRDLSSYSLREYVAVGFDEHVNRVVEQLTTGGDPPRRRIISIVGGAGSGKTTLARTIYDTREIQLYFKHRAWIFVSEEHQEDTRSILLGILEQVGDVTDHGIQNDDEIKRRVARELESGTYLLAIDNIRSAHVLGRLELPTTNAEGRVLVTARDENNAPQDSEFIYLGPLNEQSSQKLFEENARSGLQSQDDDLAARVLRICDGSPLNIVLLGGMLSTKNADRGEWNRVVGTIESRSSSSTNESWSSSILSESYHDLPFHVKPCLLYLALFPKEKDLPVRRLYRLWLAEGFLYWSKEKSSEEVAEECFQDLVRRNLLQLSGMRSDGSPKKCRMPGAVYDELFRKARDVRFFSVQGPQSESPSSSDDRQPALGQAPKAHGQQNLRRIVDYGDIGMYDSGADVYSLRSYLSLDTRKVDTPPREVGILRKIEGHRGLKLLRVLDLEGVYKPRLSNALGKLLLLRYLGLRRTCLEELPESVGRLSYLETLDLKQTYIETIPRSVWKLKNLLHLHLNGISVDTPEDPRRGRMGRLLTLWGLVVDERSLSKNDLSERGSNLRELGMTCQLSTPESRDKLADCIAGLTSLRSLRLRSDTTKGEPDQLSLKPLSNLTLLSHLYLLGHLKDLPKFPPNVVVLTLSVSKLNGDPMPTLGKLPKLEVLRLYARSYMGDKMVWSSGGFAKLKTLKLWNLTNLEEWVVEEGAKPIIKKLEIRRCTKLKAFPPRLLLGPHLENLILTAMPRKFVEEVQHNMPPNISFTDNSDWEFTQ